jgi:hypothetical protein
VAMDLSRRMAAGHSVKRGRGGQDRRGRDELCGECGCPSPADRRHLARSYERIAHALGGGMRAGRVVEAREHAAAGQRDRAGRDQREDRTAHGLLTAAQLGSAAMTATQMQPERQGHRPGLLPGHYFSMPTDIGLRAWRRAR